MNFLGVDGGGTKTAFYLINSEGDVLSEIKTPTCYYLSVGKEKAKEVIKEGIIEVCNKAQIQPFDIDFSFLGLPAYGEISADVDWLDNLPSGILKEGSWQCNNDMICGWAASLAGQDGINIVSGTGSIAYGERKGMKARCGGWGEIFSDEGSAYWIGNQALNLYTKMSDGRIPKGILYDLINKEFNLKHDLDVMDVVFNQWKSERKKIASLSKIAHEAAINNDIYAREIFFKAAKELALIIDATRTSLGYKKNEKVDVSFSGGVFNSGDLIINPLKHELSKISSNYNVLKPKYTPNIGAAIYAAKLSNAPLTVETLKKLTL